MDKQEVRYLERETLLEINRLLGYNGNKRTGLIAGSTFLLINNLQIVYADENEELVYAKEIEQLVVSKDRE